MGERIIRTKMAKSKKLLALMILPFTLNACSNKQMEVVPFNLNYSKEMFHPPVVSFFKKLSEFEDFLKDNNIFTSEPTQEFTNINAKYDESYFNNYDLSAVIVQANSGSIYGYSLEGITKEENSWIISIKSLSKGQYETHDMGAYYTYYFELEKDSNIKDCKLKNNGYLVRQN